MFKALIYCICKPCQVEFITKTQTECHITLSTEQSLVAGQMLPVLFV